MKNEILNPQEIYQAQTAEIIKELVRAGLEMPNIVFAKKLVTETDINLEAYKGQAYWLEFKDEPNGTAKSGKLFLPENYNSKLVAVYGGLPGDDIAKKEKQYVNDLLKGDYAIWVSRHNGTKLEEKNVASFLGSTEVLEERTALSKATLGEPLSANFLEDFAREPQMDMKLFNRQKNIKEITLVGHSYGAASIIYSYQKDQELNQGQDFSKVKKTILINGMFGDGTFPETEDEKIGGTHISLKQIAAGPISKSKEFFDIPEPTEVGRSFKEVLGYNYAKGLPAKAENVVIISPTDAYLTPAAAEHYYNGTASGLMIYDLTQGPTQPPQKNANKIFGPDFTEATPDIIKAANEESKQLHGGSQHSSSNLRGETLRRLVELDIKGKKHRVCLRKETVE